MIIRLYVLSLVILLTGCSLTEQQENVDQNSAVSPAYDSDSWKAIISPDCRAFYDGCNNCRRDPEGQHAMCTRMYCPVYKAPKCLDSDDRGHEIQYKCDAEKSFTVHFEAAELRLTDHQTHLELLLRQQRTASGMSYVNEEYEFRGKGADAEVLKGDELLYSGCVAPTAET